jgi:hypothetical protein
MPRAGAQMRYLPDQDSQPLLKDMPFSPVFLDCFPAQGSGFRWKNLSQSPEQQR